MTTRMKPSLAAVLAIAVAVVVSVGFEERFGGMLSPSLHWRSVVCSVLLRSISTRISIYR
ncbi:hypothetical protein GW17_00004212 [Ensete ventricosum]|nr:hypothetical protein GW17_00004212 [Ensete ventricosum]